MNAQATLNALQKKKLYFHFFTSTHSERVHTKQYFYKVIVTNHFTSVYFTLHYIVLHIFALKSHILHFSHFDTMNIVFVSHFSTTNFLYLCNFRSAFYRSFVVSDNAAEWQNSQAESSR